MREEINKIEEDQIEKNLKELCYTKRVFNKNIVCRKEAMALHAWGD